MKFSVYNILSNENFDDIESYENLNLKIDKFNDHIEIIFKLTYSTNIFIYENDNYYYLSFHHKQIFEKFGEKNVKRYYNFFNKLILYKDHYEIIEDTNISLYSVSIFSDEGIKILKDWINKYTKIIQNINPDNLCIELSGGIDTRILSYFWRNTNNTYTVYTKNDPNEVNEAINVINYINENFPVTINTVVGNKSEKYTSNSNYVNLNGGNILHGLCFSNDVKYKMNINDFYNNINNSCHSNKSKHIILDICPFYDKEYLKLKGEYDGQIKVLLLFYLCKEKNLYKLPIKSFKRELFDITEFENDLTILNLINKLENINNAK